MCTLAPESTTNSLSSSFITDGAGRHHSLASEKKVAVSVSLGFQMFLDNLHASPRAHRAPVFQSPPATDLCFLGC